MINLFNTVVYMSMTSTLAALVIISIRALLGNKLPKIFSYSLWSILLFRLLVPVSFSSALSIFNFYPVASTNVTDSTSKLIQSGAKDVIQKGSSITQTDSIVSQIGQNKIIVIWLTVTIILMIVCITIYSMTTNKFKEAIICYNIGHLEGTLGKTMLKRRIRVYSLEGLSTPIVYGILKPRILVPATLIEANDQLVLKNVIKHEMVHIQRFDNLIKLISIAAVCIHWFNPMMWGALILAHKDMERACDERVIQLSKEDIRKEYAHSLLNFSLEKNNLKSVGLVAFGESNTKKRIKGILDYKKPGFWMRSICIIILIGIGILLISDASKQTININLQAFKQEYSEEWTALDDISPYVVDAAIASEDRNFKKHNGVDWSRTAGALAANIMKGSRAQGGSTITQQLVRNISLGNEPVSLNRKRKEMYTAIRLEKNYTKDEIMEAYLNVTNYGHGAYGIGDASRFYFKKEPSLLTREEAASLIATLQAPTKYSPLLHKEINKQKAEYIISVMNELASN